MNRIDHLAWSAFFAILALAIVVSAYLGFVR